MLKDPEIEVIDIVTPPFLHVPLAIKAIKAGKHVICEKPLSGYFGKPGEEMVGINTKKSVMYESLVKEMDELKELLKTSDRKFLFAENLVYATPLQRAAEVIRKKKSKILMVQGFCALKGSSSPLAGKWNKTGGGCLIRNGCHPLGAIIWVKLEEAKARGEKITIQSVTADVGTTTKILSDYEHRHISAQPEDVEDNAVVVLTFSDGTKAVIIVSDTALGGTQNYIDIFANDAALKCQITPPDLLKSYLLDEDGLEDMQLSEMLPSKLGWNGVFVNDEIIRGYVGELQNFMETIAYDKEPVCTFEIAYEATRALYAAYISAEEGRRIDL